MATILGSLLVSLGLESAQFRKGMSDAERQMVRTQQKFERVGTKMADMGKTMSFAMTAPLVAFAGMSFKTASDAAELQSAFDQTFGAMSDAMNVWAEETGNAMGRSTQELQRAANTFGIFFNQAAPTRKEAAEMSKTFSVLAQDLASFYNVSESDALQKLRSGLSGEAEPLRDFGVFLNEASVKAKGLEMGLGSLSGELTDQEKIMARAALIMEQTANAQGDVARTSDGTANQMRSLKAAFEELQVALGSRLLPLFTPLIEGLTNLVNRFGQLSPSMQTTILVVAGLAAALGPVLFIIGNIASGIGVLLPLLPTLGATAAASATAAGGSAVGFGALGAALGSLKVALLGLLANPVVLGAAAVIGGIYLAWKNWDKILPIVQPLIDAVMQFGKELQAAIGPEVTALIDQIKTDLTALWEGPLGDGIRSVIGFLVEYYSTMMRVMGPVVIGAIKAVVAVISNFASMVASAVRGISALLRGDFSGAFQAAWDVVNRLFGGMPGYVIQQVSALVTGVRQWLVGKLGAIFDQVGNKIKATTGFFRDMYIAVVGNSYVPDMVDEIGVEMRRLDKEMVDPAQRAAQSTKQVFRDMAAEVRTLLDRLFPDAAKINQWRDDLKLLDDAEANGLLTGDASNAARGALRSSILDLKDTGKRNLVGPMLEAQTVDMEAWRKKFNQELGIAANDSETKTVRIAKSFKDMADETMNALRSMTDAIKGGDFFDILGAAVGLFTQLGSMGAFGKGIQTNLNNIPKYANGTNFHPGGLAIVGERGPELALMGRGTQVIPNRDLRNLGGGSIAQIVPSPYFDVVVDGRVQRQAPGIASTGAQMAANNNRWMQSRRLA